MSSEFQEPYMRLREKLNRDKESLLSKETELRELPAVPRQDELFKCPNLRSSKDWMAWFVFLVYHYPEADYQMNVVLGHILRVAKKNRYQGSWGIWKRLAEYFNIRQLNETIENDRQQESYQPNLNIGPLPGLEYNEGSYLNPYYLVEFLLNYYCSEDDLFGNLAVRAVFLGMRVTRVQSYQSSQRMYERRFVRRTQRHRGYRDKGSLATDSMRAMRLISDTKEVPKMPLYDTLDYTTTWGVDPTLTENTE